MESEACTRGSISRVLGKLEASISNGKYYEAHQMYRTLFFRYLAQSRFEELQEMLYNGALLFLQHRQFISGADLAILLVDVLAKSESKRFMEWTPKLCKIFASIDDATPERYTFLLNAIRWSASESRRGYPLLHQGIAKIYWNEKDYAQARSHYLHSKDGPSCARLLIEFQRSMGYGNEVDLFIVQTVLQFLCLRNAPTASQAFFSYTNQHPSIRRSSPPFLLPLLNFLWFLLKAIDGKMLRVFVVLRHKYEASLERDPAYRDYLDRIGDIFFGLKPAAPKSNGLIGSMLQTFLEGLDDVDDADSEDDSDACNHSIYEAPSCSKKLLDVSDLD